jgi:hypothetical protein
MTVVPGEPLEGVLAPVQVDGLVAAIKELWAVRLAAH